jgi:hypothetical protein
VPNLAEGVIIRSSIGRLITKRKIAEFNESKYNYDDYDNASTNLTPLEQYKIKATNLMTSNRFNNAVSKHGECEIYSNEIIDEFVNDIMFELNGYHIFGLKEWIDREALNFILTLKQV